MKRPATKEEKKILKRPAAKKRTAQEMRDEAEANEKREKLKKRRQEAVAEKEMDDKRGSLLIGDVAVTMGMESAEFNEKLGEVMSEENEEGRIVIKFLWTEKEARIKREKLRAIHGVSQVEYIQKFRFEIDFTEDVHVIFRGVKQGNQGRNPLVIAYYEDGRDKTKKQKKGTILQVGTYQLGAGKAAKMMADLMQEGRDYIAEKGTVPGVDEEWDMMEIKNYLTNVRDRWSREFSEIGSWNVPMVRRDRIF